MLDMEIERQNLPKSRCQFVASLSPDEVATHFDYALKNLAASVKLPGFRPGKAPANLVKEQIDSAKLREEAYSLAVQASWREITKLLATSDWQSSQNSKQKSQKPDARSQMLAIPIQDPEVELGEFEEGQPAKITFEFDVRPEVNFRRWYLMAPTVPRQEGERLAVQFAHQQFVGRFAERGGHSYPSSIDQAFDIVDAASTDDCQHGFLRIVG